MEDPKPSKLDRLKAAAKKHREPIIAGTSFAVGVAATLWCIKNPDRVASRYPWGSSYNPDRPISDLLLNEEQIKRRIAAGILYALFVRDKHLTDEFAEFVEFANQHVAEFVESAQT